MAVSPSFRTFVLEQLGRATPAVRGRSMFGGLGIYSEDLFFAIVADDTLYLKVDDSNRPDFEALGVGPFRPYDNDSEIMQYYEVPADLLEDADALRPWVAGAIEVASRRKSVKRGRPQRKRGRRSP